MIDSKSTLDIGKHVSLICLHELNLPRKKREETKVGRNLVWIQGSRTSRWVKTSPPFNFFIIVLQQKSFRLEVIRAVPKIWRSMEIIYLDTEMFEQPYRRQGKCIGAEPRYKYYTNILVTKIAVNDRLLQHYHEINDMHGFQGNGPHLNLKGLPTKYSNRKIDTEQWGVSIHFPSLG